jgi:hypothetical protein
VDCGYRAVEEGLVFADPTNTIALRYFYRATMMMRGVHTCCACSRDNAMVNDDRGGEQSRGRG